MAYQALKTKMILPGGSGSWILFWILFSHTWGLMRMRITSTGIIKGCVQRDQFHKWLLLASIPGRALFKRPEIEAS